MSAHKNAYVETHIAFPPPTMSVEALLTVITVVLAVIALIPQERGEDLRIRLGGSPLLATLVALALVTYWTLLEPLHSLPGLRRLPRLVPWITGWTSAATSLVVLLAATGFAGWRYRRQIPFSRLTKLATAVNTALARRRFAECLHLLEAHLPRIRLALEGAYWQGQLRSRLYPTPAELHLRSLKAPIHPQATRSSSPALGDR